MLGPRPTSERLRAIEFRIDFLRASLDSLQALAEAGDEILEADTASPPRKLIPYTIRASIIVMACAMIDGCLVDLTNENQGRSEKVRLRIQRRPRIIPRQSASIFFKKVARLGFPDETQTWSKLKAYFATSPRAGTYIKKC